MIYITKKKGKKTMSSVNVNINSYKLDQSQVGIIFKIVQKILHITIIDIQISIIDVSHILLIKKFAFNCSIAFETCE